MTGCRPWQPVAAVRRAIMRQYRCGIWLLAVLICGLATTARAEVHVEGIPAAVRVTTSRDAISDVLSAFAATFNVRYRSAVPLDATADASYSGSFTQVISRLLDGYNYVIKRDRETIEIVEVSIPPPASSTPPAKGIVSQWR